MTSTGGVDVAVGVRLGVRLGLTVALGVPVLLGVALGVVVGVWLGVAVGVMLWVAVGLGVGESVAVGLGVNVEVGRIATGKTRILVSPEFTVHALGFSPATKARPAGSQNDVDHSPGIKAGKSKRPSASVRP
jgi:hypothetical protein